jgi:hypothetical protein
MGLSLRIRCGCLTFIVGLLLQTVSGVSQQKPQPTVAVDLRPLGAAADLFAAPNDSKYEQRGIIDLFWLRGDEIAVAFSMNRRWSNSEKPEPLLVRLVVFDRGGKQLNERNWTFGAEGPAGSATLDLLPGPDDSILAIHNTSAGGPGAGTIPEGNFVQVLNADTSLRQSFYIPGTSAYVPDKGTEAGLVLQTFYASKRSSLVWWSGKPMRPGLKIELSEGGEPILAGPGVAARSVCPTPKLCTGLQVFRAGATPWSYKTPTIEFLPIPHLFLSPTALLFELRYADQKQGRFFIAHPGEKVNLLPALPKDQVIDAVTGVSSNGSRFAVDTSQEVGLCGGLDLWCRQRGNVLIYDIPANRIVFQQEVSATGAVSAISPDGRAVAIFDRDKLMVYPLP